MRRSWWLGLLPILAAAQVPNRYVVELSTEPVASYVTGSSARAGLRPSIQEAGAQWLQARIRSEQQRVRLLLEREHATVLASVQTVANALIVTAPDEVSARIAQLPGVRRVLAVERYRLLLDHAIPLHHVPEAWGRVGPERAGAGVKIAIIDTGIDADHPGFQDPALAMPAGFPKINAETDKPFINSKVIVARSYADLFENPDPDTSARDREGHGTATAMAAAGVRNAGTLAIITGVAPKAYLGSYKIFGSPGVNDSATGDAVLKAIDDAVADGMDVINLSLGSPVASRPADDILVQALERAAALGIVVVVAAGNTGPDPNTIASPATGASVLAVGALYNDRVFSAVVSVAGVGEYRAVPGSGPAPSDAITAPLMDVAKIDGTGLACGPLEQNSLRGYIALILRGTCFFEDKLKNVEQAGAVAALVYSDPDRPQPITIAAGSSTLPAEMISYQNGTAIKERLEQPLDATLRFTLQPLAAESTGLAPFSAKGPNVDGTIKPDLLAVGTDVYTATQRFDTGGEMFRANGYITASGTSFFEPHRGGCCCRAQIGTAESYCLAVPFPAGEQCYPGHDGRFDEGSTRRGRTTRRGGHSGFARSPTFHNSRLAYVSQLWNWRRGRASQPFAHTYESRNRGRGLAVFRYPSGQCARSIFDHINSPTSSERLAGCPR